MREPCPFCRRDALEVIAENDLAFALRDRKPVTPLHTLIIPKRHVETIFDASEAENEAIRQLALSSRAAIQREDPSVEGFNFGSNMGAAAGQKVFHAHLHLIPRRFGEPPPPAARPDTDEAEPPLPRKLSRDEVLSCVHWPRPAREPLEGRFIRLEPLDPELHAAPLFHASHGCAEARRIWDYLPIGPFPDEESFRAALHAGAKRDWVTFALRPQGSDEPCGMASYLDIDPAHGVIEIGGLWFAPSLQRTRAATEALFLMLSHALDDLSYRRMQWRANAFNERSRRAAQRLGFRFEGVFHQHMVVKGANRDTAWFSILDREWPEIRGVIEGWLADDNFDAQGCARSSLGERMRTRHP